MSAFPSGLLCPLLFIGIFIFAIIAIVRLGRKSASGGLGGSGRPAVNVPTELDQDGFWMVSCPANPGSIIHYHYWSGGVRYSGQVPFKPGGDGRQFVYTGRRPEQVSVTRVVEVDDDDLTGSVIPPIIAAGSTWDPPNPPSPPPSPSSFPSAY
jgi:hypothetical protein